MTSEKTFIRDSLRGIHWLLLMFIPLSAPFATGRVLWTAGIGKGAFVWVGFRSIILNPVDIVLLLFVVVGILRLSFVKQDRERLLNTTLTIMQFLGGSWWIILMLWSTLTGQWAISPQLGNFNALHLIVELFVAVWLADFVQQGSAQSFLFSFGIPSVIYSLMAAAQVIHNGSLGLSWLGELQRNPQNPFGFGAQEFRGYAFALHPNNLAGFLVIGLFAQMLLLAEAAPHSRRTAYLALAGIMITGLGLLATISRTAIIAVAITLPPTAIVLFMHNFSLRNKKAILLTALVLPLVVVGFLAFNRTFTANIGDRLSILLKGPKAVASRLTYAFPDTTQVIRESPVWGSGNGNLMLEISQHDANIQGLFLPAHNVFWVMWAELGIPGLAIFLLGLLFVLVRTHPTNGIGVFTLGMAFVAFVIIMAFDFYPWGDLRTRLLLFWMLGMWWGYCLRDHRHYFEAAESLHLSSPS